MCDVLTVNDSKYTVLRLLGKGKGGYSYLVTDGFNLAGTGACYVPSAVSGRAEHRLLSDQFCPMQGRTLLYRL